MPQLKIFKPISKLWRNIHIEEINKIPLIKQEIVYTNDPDECDICVSRRMKPLKALIQKYGSSKKYLFWNNEPRADVPHTHQVSFDGVDIHIMSAYTGDIWMNNYFAFDHKRWMNNPNPLENQSDFSRPKQKKVVTLIGYRNDKEAWSIVRNGVEIDLCYLRTKIALEGHQQGKIDIYGKGWPEGIALEDSRTIADWRDRKQDILQDYSFNLCFENTNIDYYCTEKIWDSIQAGCLPIYYGKGNKIYEDFPQESFLDYADFNDSSILLDYLENMSLKEFRKRLNLCIEVADNLAKKICKNKEIKQQERVYKIVEKINLLINT